MRLHGFGTGQPGGSNSGLKNANEWATEAERFLTKSSAAGVRSPAVVSISNACTTMRLWKFERDEEIWNMTENMQKFLEKVSANKELQDRVNQMTKEGLV